MYFLKVFGILGFVLLLEARPPKDLIIEPPARQSGTPIIRDKNVTFTNTHPEKDEEPVVEEIKVLFNVKGRSRPHRSGNVLSVLKAGAVVEPFRRSSDKKWVGVVVQSSGLKVWIPVASLPPLTEKFKLAKTQSKSSSSTDSEVESE